MSRKSLNKQNLERLGAAKLAALIMELTQGSAALKRRARMELSAAHGHAEIAADLRKRLASIQRSTSWLSSRKLRELLKDLDSLLDVIEAKIAPQNPNEAFELVWTILTLAPRINERSDDKLDMIGDLRSSAMDIIKQSIAPDALLKPATLAERILDVTVSADDGQFDGIVSATAPILKDTGLEHLKTIINAWAISPLEEFELQSDNSRGLEVRSIDKIAQDNRDKVRSRILAEIADAQGDIDSYMLLYHDERLNYGTTAWGAGQRLLAAERVDEAFEIVSIARTACSYNIPSELNLIYEECLEKLGRSDDLRQHLWDSFSQRLDEQALRKYLKLLPDFEDLDAEEEALTLAEQFPDIATAVNFLLKWPSATLAARVIVQRVTELNGDDYIWMTNAANDLDAEFPLAATLLRRSMIESILKETKKKRYRHAVKHLAACAISDASIPEYLPFATHEEFMRKLRKDHKTIQRFWALVSEI